MQRAQRHGWVAVFCALLLTNGAARAAGDAAAGETKAIACAGCHGVEGISPSPQWPNLAGQKDVYLVKQLRDFRSGARSDPVMAIAVAPLTDADIADLAAYFSTRSVSP
jgi:cytochrome c553